MGDYKNDEWANGEGTLEGRVTFIRKNVSLYETRKASYPHALIVSLLYQDARDDGLPGSDEELHRLDDIEEAIADRFCSRHDALFAMCITTDGSRDMFLFLPKAPQEKEIVAEIQACAPAVDFDFSLDHDPDWKLFMAFLPDTDPRGSRAPWWRRLFGSS